MKPITNTPAANIHTIPFFRKKTETIQTGEPSLYELLQNSPFSDTELSLERDKTPMSMRETAL